MPYLVLALDGGGIRGVFTTTILGRLEQAVPGFLAKVDLFAGTSTGGIIALGLAAGLTPHDLTRLYLDRGAEIFESRYGVLDHVAKLAWAEYDNRNLVRILEETFAARGVATLGDLPRRVLVPTFDLDSAGRPGRAPDAPRTWKPKFFHNYPGPGGDAGARIVDVALRTSAGPTYFPTHQGYVDGGVIANNPSMAALAQAIHPGSGRQRLEDVCLLSIGTGQRPRFIAGADHDWGIVPWAGHLVDLLIEGGMDTARYECQQLLGERFCRVDTVLAEEMDLDAVAGAVALVERAANLPLDGTVSWVRRWFHA